MRLATRPRKGQTYSGYMHEWAVALQSGMVITSAGALTARPFDSSMMGRLGRLDERHTDSLTNASYVVFSYATPIAWFSKAEGWVMPERIYSLTTSSHQSHIANALKVYARADIRKV